MEQRAEKKIYMEKLGKRAVSAKETVAFLNVIQRQEGLILAADALVAQAKREIGSQEVVMLLMHDGAGNEASVEALPEILRYCQEQGYEFRVIDETTPQFHHHINN